MTAPAPVSKLGFVEVRSRDVERIAAYYQEALGFELTEREGGAAYLTTGPDHHCVVVAEGEPDGRARLGFEVARPLDDVAAALERAGVAARRVTDPEPGVADALVLAEVLTDTPLVLYERQAASGAAPAVGTRPTKLGHVASYTPDLAAHQAFYQDVLGFRWSDTIGDFFAFLRCNADHHAINLMQSQKRAGLFHVAFELRDFMHLKDALDLLAAQSIRLEWGPGRHGAGHNIFTYHRDPDGNIVELFTEIDQVVDERTGQFAPRPWHERWPQEPQVWEPAPAAANKWGPVNLEFMDH
jgi:catechol-2,3-dioxygenase